MSNPREPSQLFTVAEIASRLRVSKMTIYRMIHDGTLPAIRISRSFRIPAQAVDELLRNDGIEL